MEDKVKYWCNCYEDTKKFIYDKYNEYTNDLIRCDDETIKLHILNNITTYELLIREMKNIEKRNNEE